MSTDSQSRRLGPYVLGGALGRGGMATVFAATHRPTGRAVALKVLRPELLSHEGARRRFIREARASSQVQHPNVVQVFDVGIEHGIPFISMERLSGESLQDVLTMRRRLPAAEVLEYLVPIMEAVALLHARGLIHRDLKPSNIFLSGNDGRPVPKLLDFGIAKLLGDDSGLDTQHAVGTPFYMPPEQLEHAGQVSPAADVWAMGVMLYRALCGELPFVAETREALIYAITVGTRPSLHDLDTGAPRALVDAVEHALAHDPAERFADMGGFLRELHAQRLVAPADFAPGTPKDEPPPNEPSTRPSLIAGVIAAAILGAVGWLLLGSRPPPVEVIPIEVEEKPAIVLADDWLESEDAAGESSPASGESDSELVPAPVEAPTPPEDERARAESDDELVPDEAVADAPEPPLDIDALPATDTAGGPSDEGDDGEVRKLTEAQVREKASRAFARAREARRAGRTADALAAFDEAVFIQPTFVPALAGRAALRRDRGDLDGALRDIERALTLEPRRPELLDGRGRVRVALGQLDGAVADFQRAVDGDGKQDVFRQNLLSALFLRAKSFQFDGDRDRARRDLDRILKSAPTHRLALRRRGFLRLEKGDQGGRQDLERYLAVETDERQKLEIARLLGR